MQVEKKRIRKEDGRYLIYYHFPESAGPEETAAFQNARDQEPNAEPAAQPAATPKQEEKANV